MSGHSKWSTIKHKKSVEDARRANVFTKFTRLIMVAAKEGGGDPEANFKLKIAINQAQSVNMPKNNIERAIKNGTGELKNKAMIEEIIYEAYGPGNVAILIKTATDNRNRTASEIKSILTKTGGKMVSSGSVSFIFKQVGVIVIEARDKNKEELELKSIETGAEDIEWKGDQLIIYTKPNELQKVKEKLESFGLKISEMSIAYVATQKTKLDPQSKNDYENLLEKLNEQDDVQEIYSNIGI